MLDVLTGVKAYSQAANDIYLKSLISPESYVAKIPGPLPISSATAAIRDNFSITPNSSGKFLLIIDPFYNKGMLYQSDSVDGKGNGTATEITFGQNNDIVDQFRLVSASVILRYYGNFNQMSGIFVAATTSNVKGGNANTGFSDFLNFSNIEDLTNKFVSKCIDGVKMIYSPMDNRAVEFRLGKEYSPGQNETSHPCRWQYLFVIMGDLFPNTTCIRVDYYRNIEYTTTPLYREYILQSKSLPSNFILPIINNTISSAPDKYGGNSLNDNNIPYFLKIMQVALRSGNSLSPFMLE